MSLVGKFPERQQDFNDTPLWCKMVGIFSTNGVIT
jgi:hypothetical protein